MAIVASDVLIKLSILTGAAGNANAQADPNQSLGKYMSTTDMTAGANSLFDNVSGAENAANESEYRCLFVFNNHATLTALGVVVYLSSEVAGGAGIAIAVDSTAASAKGSATAQALTVANEDTAPAGPLTFSSPTTAAAGIVLGDIPAGSCRAFWVRRTTASSAALDSDGVTFGFSFDTAA
jgi:hypothetical protein